MRSLCAFILGLVALVFAAQDAAAERRAALVFGADAYKFLRPLDNGGRDAARVAEILRSLDFEVTLETDRDLRRMRRALEDFEADHQGAEVALIFYAGHGVELAGENLILPIDADPTSLETLRGSALRLEELRDVAVRMAPVALILIDACREDPFGEAPGAEGRGGVRLAPQVKSAVQPGMGRMGDARNTLFAFSTAPGALAADGDGNSPFTLALAKYLATPGIEIRSALTLVQQEVYDQTGGRQLPYIENGLPQLYFVSAPATGELPERERLLLAMAGLGDGLRQMTEEVAGAYNVPLATLYGAVLAAGLDAAAPDRLRAGLIEAAESYLRLAEMMRSFSASDPEVQALREQAEQRLSLGALNEALELVRQARQLDAGALADIGRIRTERTLSSALSARLEAQISRTALDHLAAIRALEEAEALYQSVDANAIPEDHYFERGRMLFDLGSLKVTVGDSAGAVATFGGLVRVTELWLEHGSQDSRAWQQQARALMALGHVHTTRAELDEAVLALDMASDLVAQLLQIFPGEPVLLSDLVYTLMMIGDLRERQGRPDLAAQRFAEAVDVTEAELARMPGDPDLTEQLSNGLARLGDAEWSIGEMKRAETSYRRAEQLARDLVAQQPGSAARQRNLMVAIMKLASLLRDGHDPAALTYYHEAVEISRFAVDNDPQNTLRRSDLAAALGEVAATLIRMDRTEEAIPHLQEALLLGRSLAELDPDKVEWQRALALTYLSLAEAGDQPFANLLAGRALLVRLRDSGRIAPMESKLLELFDRALRDLELGNWPPKVAAAGLAEDSKSAPPREAPPQRVPGTTVSPLPGTPADPEAKAPEAPAEDAPAKPRRRR